MAKYVIDMVELKKRQYVIDAFSEQEAIGKLEDAEPHTIEVLSDTIYGIHTINEYEYKKEWVKTPEKKVQKDMFEETRKHKEMFEDSNDIWRDD